MLGILGLILPLLPHTPFFLAAAALFAKGSPRIHQALLSNRYIGPVIQNWTEQKRISKKAKCLALLWIVLSIGYSMWAVKILALRVMLFLIGVSVSTFILTRKS